MMTNNAIQNPAVIAWDGTTAYTHDVRKFIGFAFSFLTTAAVTTDAVFNVLGHDPSVADNCVAGPAIPIPEVVICDRPIVPAEQAQLTIPAGTPAGTLCRVGLPCRPHAFMSLAAASGDTANVQVTLNLYGPTL